MQELNSSVPNLKIGVPITRSDSMRLRPPGNIRMESVNRQGKCSFELILTRNFSTMPSSMQQLYTTCYQLKELPNPTATSRHHTNSFTDSNLRSKTFVSLDAPPFESGTQQVSKTLTANNLADGTYKRVSDVSSLDYRTTVPVGCFTLQTHDYQNPSPTMPYSTNPSQHLLLSHFHPSPAASPTET